MDIVVANSGINAIGFFLLYDNGTFANQQIYSTGLESYPHSVAVSDFNNDKYFDIAVANYGTNNIGIFLGCGNGTFASQKLFSIGSSRPLFITTGDFNNDNRSDIAVVNYGTNDIGVLLGDGNGSFLAQAIYSTDYDSLPYSLAVGDFNKDNQLDIVVANFGIDNIGIFLGYGNGSFTNQKTYTTRHGSHPSSIAVGDINNDNQLDIVVANSGASNVGIILGYGDGTFADQIIFSIGSSSRPQFITVGDFNQDNKLDVVIVDTENDQIHILHGYGNGTFNIVSTYDAMAESRPFLVAVADFNNDNRSNLVVANYGSNNVLVLTGYSSKPSARQTTYYLGHESRPMSVAIGDFNNDDHLDIIVNNLGNDSVLVLIGYGNRTFGNEMTYSTGTGSAPQCVCVGDLNNDTQLDIITANLGTDSVGILFGYGNGIFTNVITYSTSIGSAPRSVALGDLNNDDQVDIITANSNSDSVGVLLGQHNGTFATVITFSTGMNSAPRSIAVGDFNNDTWLDIVVANTGTNNVCILLGNGNGIFLIKGIYNTGINSAPLSVVVTDFNNDKQLDIAVANPNGNSINVLFGNGDGTFEIQLLYSSGSISAPYSVAVADFNNDNQLDLAINSLGNNEVIIYFGRRNGSFDLGRIYSTGDNSRPFGIAVANLDNDNQLEIVVTFWGTGQVAILTEYNAAEFVNQVIYSTGSGPQPYSTATADFNNDGRMDIVVAKAGIDVLSVLFGSNDSTYGLEVTYIVDTCSYPQYVITGDINNDNNLDIVAANSKGDSISVIMGNGNGTFSKQMLYSTGNGSHPYAVALDDFNNDHRLDLVIANEGTDNIGIFIGYDYAFFQSDKTYSEIHSLAPYAIVVCDFNKDNHLDIAAIFAKSNYVGVLLGYGNGSFGTMMTYSTGNSSKPFALAVGDFNNDSHWDIVVANSVTNNIGVLLGYSNGSFATIMTYSTGNSSRPYAVAVGDFNQDSQLDIAVANSGTNNVAIFLGYGNRRFADAISYSTGNDSKPYCIVVGDFNQDGLLDIAVANYGTNNVGILLGYGNGSFADQVTYSTGYYSQPFWIAIGDLNSDHRLDIVSANFNGGNVGILLGYGNGTFASATRYSTGDGSTPTYVGIGHFNNDSYLDIAVVNYGINNIVVLFGFGDGSFLLGETYSSGIGSGPLALAIGDFDNNTRLDIAVANSRLNSIGVFLGFGSKPYGNMMAYTTGAGSQPHSIAVSDFNKDGLLDIVVTNYGTDNVGVLFGSGHGAFNAMITYSTGIGSAPYCVAVGDFNHDSQLDIVVTNSENDNVAILLGKDNGTFAIKAMYSTGYGSRPYIVTVADFNNDHISDIAVANSGTNNILILYGYGNGTFGNEESYPLGYDYRPYSIAANDLNGDGWMDIVVACYGTNNVDILMKLC